MDVLEVSDGFEEGVLEPGVLDVLAKIAAEERVVIHHLPDDLGEVRVEVSQVFRQALLQ